MRLKPIIQHCVVAALLVLPLPSWAVGLGRLTLQSGLGQVLSAEIELTSVQPGELDTMTARLADQATYSKNNIEFGNALARVRVVLDPRGGRPVLKVSSTQAINEPFLDLLIELNWAAGRLLREYTFLLDPPGFAATTPVEPAAAIPAQSLAPAAPIAGGAAASSLAPQASGAGTYGPVKRGETLGKIAAKVKSEGVTLEQMLAALYRANARAFDGKNMNRLRAGQILTVPKGEDAAGIPNDEANKEIRVQAADWRAYRDRLAGAVAIGETQGARQAAGGRITMPIEDKVASAPGADKLRLSRGDTVPGATGGAGRAENAVAAQKAMAEANSRVTDLEKQVKDLQRLLELKNSALQAQQLAVEQAKTATKGAAPPASPAVLAPPTQTISPTPAAPVAATPPAAATPAPPAAPPAGEPAKVEADKAPTLAAADTSSAVSAKSEPKSSDTNAPATKAEPTVPKAPPQPPQPQPEVSFLDDLPVSPYVLVGGGAVIGLGIVAVMLARRRNRATTKFEDSISAGTDIRTSTVFGSTGGGVVNTGDNSLVSDFSREGLGNIDTGEVDPIAEAEVYLAYGRDNQAEEILRDALGKTPDRQEIRLKLLEIYAQQNKPAAFEPIAAEVFAATNGSGEIWTKAAQLGRGIDPGNPMYAERAELGGAAAPATPTPIVDDRLPDTRTRVAAAVEKSAFETEFQLPEAPAKEVFVMPPALTPAERAPAVTQAERAPIERAPAVAAAVASAPAASSLSAPLAAAAAASVAAATAARATAAHERAPLDFKLDSGPELAPHGVPPTMDFVTLDGPITLSGATTLSGPSTLSGVTLAAPSAGIWGEKPLAPLHEKVPVAPPLQPAKSPELKPSDVIKPAVAAAVADGTVSIAGFSAMGTPTVMRAPQPSGKLELDKLDLSFDPSRKVFNDPTPSVLDGQWHDAATKLDLAKAYQEMGDIEGAREILQEVVQEGDEHQKKEAQAFLVKLRS
jgi:pilus assembly protein FimV